MVVYEIFLTLRGKSNLKRWKIVSRQLVITTCILAIIWATGVLLTNLITSKELAVILPVNTGTNLEKNAAWLFLTPFILLSALIVFLTTIRLSLRLHKRFS